MIITFWSNENLQENELFRDKLKGLDFTLALIIEQTDFSA